MDIEVQLSTGSVAQDFGAAMPLLARQAIYNKDLNVVAYELLFRSCQTNAAVFDCENAATCAVILNAFTGLPVGEILEGKPAWINFTATLLDEPPPISRERLVVEVLETVPINASTLAAIRQLKQQGYTIVLDDYRYQPDQHELLAMADVIKLDVLEYDLDSLAQQVQLLQPFGAQLLAEKVENYEMLAVCKGLGFELFQGYFLSKPQLVEGKKATANQQMALRLLALLENPDVEFKDVEAALVADPVLSFKLLRLVNSAGTRTVVEIDSLHRAIALLGLAKVKSLAALLSLARCTDKPLALCTNTMIRTRMCQLLAEALGAGADLINSAFTVGLLSSLDAYLDMPLAELLQELQLSKHLQAAVLHHMDIEGVLLHTVLCFERAEFEQVKWSALEKLALSPVLVEQAYIASLAWSAEHAALLS